MRTEPHLDVSREGEQGLDHGVGHSLLLLYDVKVSSCQNSKEFKALGHYLSSTSLDIFRSKLKRGIHTTI